MKLKVTAEMIEDQKNIVAEKLLKLQKVNENGADPLSRAFLKASNSYLEQKNILSDMEKDFYQESIKELTETIEILEKKTLNAKSENMKIKLENLDLRENATAGTASHNARGAGRKQQITPEQIANIQMLREQGKKLQEIQDITSISYGNIQKYCKLITDNNKKRAGL